MYNFFKNLFKKNEIVNLGVLLDTRSPEEKQADHKFEEIVAKASSVNWKELRPDEIRVFGIQNQSGKSDCVAESRRKLKRILFKVNKNLNLDFSAVAFYRKRSNYPGGGMGSADAIALDQNVGMTLDVLVPSDVVKTEQEANSIKPELYNNDIAQVFRTANKDIIFTPGDLEAPAGTIQTTRKGVMMWFYFSSKYNEWGLEVPQVIDKNLDLYDDSTTWRHSVVGIEPALYKGQKGIWVDDSAHFGGLSRRFVTEEFYKARNFFASYPISFRFEGDQGNKPRFIEGDTVSLQNCLKYEGVFPTNIDSTGFYGSITTEAVKKFQTKYGLEPVGTVGPKTKEKLARLYP